MLRNKFLSASLLAAFATVGIWGCADIPSDLKITQKLAQNPVTVFGKVINAQTRQGIGGATVYLKVNGDWISTTTSSDTSAVGDTLGAGDSRTGDWTISGLPVNTKVVVLVKGPANSGLLQVSGNMTTPDYTANAQGVNTVISKDWGQWEMDKGVVATVYVVDSNTGSYVTKSDSSALPVYLGMGGNGSVEDVMAVRDTTDTNKYTITIPQDQSSTLTVPALDTTADGKYDYQTGNVAITTSGGVVSGVGTLTTTIALAPITNGTALAVAASNVRTVGSNSGGTALTVIGKSEPVKLLFNMPVALPTTTTDGVTMTFTDNFKTLTAAAAVTEVTVTAALSSGNTLLTVTPSAALTEGETYTLKGTVTSSTQTGAADSVYTLGTTSVTVTQTGTGTIGSTPTVTVDNFNHWTNGAVITATDPIAQANGNANLVFPEPVWGTVRLISSTTGTTTTISNGTPVALTGQGVTYVIKALSTDAFNTHGGNVSGAIYPFDMTAAGMVATVADNLTATPRSLMLGIDAYDADGNTMRTEASYSVQ